MSTSRPLGSLELKRQHQSYTYKNGLVYNGPLLHGLPHGTGIQTFSNGKIRYKGRFQHGKFHGRGVLYHENESTVAYEGDFCEGSLHGHGTYRYLKSGAVYVGDFERNKKHGTGCLTWSDGTRYQGSFVANERHGFGTYSRPTGRKYEGFFQHDKRHGLGTITNAHGSIVYKGKWLHGKPILNPLWTISLDDECCICHDSYASRDQLVVTECRHVFHKECLEGWLEGGKRTTCPTCRTSGLHIVTTDKRRRFGPVSIVV